MESVGGAERREFVAVKSDNGEEDFITYFKIEAMDMLEGIS